MKKTFFAATLAAAVILFGCGMAFTLAGLADSGEAPIAQSASGEEAAPETAPEAPGRILRTETLRPSACLSIRTSGGGDGCTVIRTKAELAAWYAAAKASCGLDKRCGTVSFREAMNTYGDAFFAEHALLLVQLREADGSAVPKAVGVSDGGDVYVERGRDDSLPAGGGRWCLLVSLETDHPALQGGAFRIVEY